MVEKTNSKNEESSKENIGPELIDRETIKEMKDEPRDGREDRYTRFWAVSRTVEKEEWPPLTAVLYVDTSGTHGFDREFPFQLGWKALPRSVVVPKNSPVERLPEKAHEAINSVLEQYTGVSIDEDRSVDWRLKES